MCSGSLGESSAKLDLRFHVIAQVISKAILRAARSVKGEGGFGVTLPNLVLHDK